MRSKGKKDEMDLEKCASTLHLGMFFYLYIFIIRKKFFLE